MLRLISCTKVTDGWAATPPKLQVWKGVGEHKIVIRDHTYTVPKELKGPDSVDFWISTYEIEGDWLADLSRFYVRGLDALAVRIYAGDTQIGFGIPDVETGWAEISSDPLILSSCEVEKSPIRIYIISQSDTMPTVTFTSRDLVETEDERYIIVKSIWDQDREYYVNNGELCPTWPAEKLIA
jgi:hypothetical protein